MSVLQSIDRRVAVGTQVYDAIEEAIVKLELKPGQFLSENELALRLGVSRTPVREALIGLRSRGLVESHPQVGTFVAKIDLNQVYEAQFIREALETACVRQATITQDADAIDELSELIKQQRRCVAKHDFDGFYSLDERLHHQIARMSGHAGVWETTRNSKVYLDRVRRLSLPMPTLLDQLTKQHADIVTGIRNGDIAAAENAVRTHVREVLRVVEPLRHEFSEYFADASAVHRPDVGGPGET